jgi:hypothetical protein
MVLSRSQIEKMDMPQMECQKGIPEDDTYVAVYRIADFNQCFIYYEFLCILFVFAVSSLARTFESNSKQIRDFLL